MSVPEVEEINISCEAGMEESFPGASAPKNKIGLRKVTHDFKMLHFNI